MKPIAPSESAVFAPPTETRTWKHPDGRTYALRVTDCRVHECWSAKCGGSNVATRETESEAHAFANTKARALVRQGFIEGERVKAEAKPRVDVIETRRAEVDARGCAHYDYQPLPGRSHCHGYVKPHVLAGWLVTSDDRARGIELRAMIVKDLDDETAAISKACLDVLGAHRVAIFADETTPLRRFPLPAGSQRFDHVVVLSPAVSGADNKALEGSLYDAFPAFACDVTGTESFALADARCRGRGSIPTARWDRERHPVVDLAFLRKAVETPEFKVYAPNELVNRVSARGLERMKATAVIARNHAGDTRTFTSATLPSQPDLRASFGFSV